MPILTEDIKLLKSAVMADVPEGGGAITSNEILDGGSNTIFPDVSELDRALGSVRLRQIAAAVRTDGTPVYMGANMIVAEPPTDPRVSVTLFAARPFEQRSGAVSRVESYLTTGPQWYGFLFENHLQGQRTVQIFQRQNSEPPQIGETLVLTQNEGLSTQRQQYVRVIVVSSVVREFTKSNGEPYFARIVTAEISDALRFDFTGSPPSEFFTRATGSAIIRETTVADAGTYAGASPTTQAAGVGDFGVQVASIFTNLVPTAQTEIPISDVRVNGLSAALVATGGPVTQTINTVFAVANALHVGGPIYPGSLSIVRAGVTVTDRGGMLMSAGAQVGAVDYDNGICTLSASVWGTVGGTHQVTFTPAAVPDLISDQRAIYVSAETRALNYVFVMEDVPLPRTLSISYIAQGRWYVLRCDGSGKISGIDSAYGMGTVSFATGGVSVTLGALPDVGSSVLVQSYSAVATVAASNTTLTNGGRVYAAINSDGLLSEQKGSKSIAIGSLAVAWMGTDDEPKLATDNGFGVLTGDATGSVDYTQGVVRISPNELPAPGTVFLLDLNGAQNVQANNVPLTNGNIGATNITPGSVSFIAAVEITYALRPAVVSAGGQFLTTTERAISVLIADDGLGGLRYKDPGNGQLVACGTINYATGVVNVNRTPTVSDADLGGVIIYVRGYWVYPSAWDAALGTRSADITQLAASISYSSELPGADSISATVTQYLASPLMVPGYTLKGVRFALGGTQYAQLTDGTLLRDINPATGGGTPAGSVSGVAGRVAISSWPVGASPVLADWRGLIAPPAVGVEAPFTAFSTVFRSASSPLRPGSVSVLGTLQDGTPVNVTANAAGQINGTRVKGRVNYQSGLIELFFVNPAGDEALNVDLSGLQIPGVGTLPADLAMLAGLRYNAVAFSYLPLDAGLIGLDPVRLPSDGRAPMYRKGGVVVVGNTGNITATVSNGQSINCARVRLSRVRVFGADGNLVQGGYTNDLEGGIVTFTDVSGYAQPVTIEHRVEDMAVVREVNINGELLLTRPLTHAYPTGSVVSSAIMGAEIGSNLFARVSRVYDQATWTGVWSDDLIGSAALASFNHAQYPIVTTNNGAVTERWALRFTNPTTFDVIGENVGFVGQGDTATDCAPVNPATGVPFFTLPALGWGGGWAAGNVLRINTIDAMLRAWALMTVQQGPSTVARDSWQLLARGSVDTP